MSDIEEHVKIKLTKSLHSYLCEVCSKTYFSQSQLDSHMKRHFDGSLTCQECGDSFSDSRKLSDHKIIHQQVQCPGCNKTIPNTFQ